MSKKMDGGTKRKRNKQQLIAELSGGLELWRVDIDDVHEQQLNAHVMPPEMLSRLTENIKRRGAPESIPFTVKRESKSGRVQFELISGHHRTRAIRNAGITEMVILADTNSLSRSQVVAKQIAHNAIVGKDDPQILSQMLREIDNAIDMIETSLDPADYGLAMEPLPVKTLPVLVDFEYRWVTFMFLPSQMERFDEVADRLKGNESLVGACDKSVYEPFKKAIRQVGEEYNVRNLGAILMKMCDIVDGVLGESTRVEDKE